MIYEMVKESLVSLKLQWSDLAKAFEVLKEKLPAGHPAIGLLDNNTPKPDPARGLIQCSQDEGERIEAEIIEPVPQPKPSAQQLLQEASVIFRASDAELRIALVPGRNPILSRFQNEFGEDDKNDDLAETTICRAQLRHLATFIASCIQEFEEILSEEGGRFQIKGIKTSVEDLNSYPLLTSQVGGYSGATLTPSTAAPSSGSSNGGLQRLVDGALREVLGRVPKISDTRSFLASLNQSFSLTEIEGHVEFAWTPRSYAGQTDLGGGVTGAQASLYTRAKVALENALPLLEGIYPLLPEADEEEIVAARAIVRSEFVEIVNELGVEGGPRRSRVDTLFALLLDQQTTGIDGKLVKGGKLGYLKHVMGLEEGQVNTLEEENNVTNFQVLQDYIASLRDSWKTFDSVWFGKDLGTRLVQLSRALSVVSETVGEIYAAMDSVFVGAAERQVASFRLSDGRTMLVEELLSWVVTFTSDEAPRLVYEGGRRGVEAIIPTAKTLEELVTQLLGALLSDPLLPKGLRHPRVQHPLQELSSYLRQVQNLAQSVRKPNL